MISKYLFKKSFNSRQLYSVQNMMFSTSKVNQFYIQNNPVPVTFTPKNNKAKGLNRNHSKSEPWNIDTIMKSTEEHVMFTWGDTDSMRKGAIPMQRGEGIYLVEYNGKKYIDMSSQALNNNLGYTIPPTVLNAITKQLQTLPMVYGGLVISEPRAKLA